jgi:hypothetical protein
MNQNLVKQKLGNHQSLARHWEEATNSLYISSIGWSDSLLLVREEIMGRKLNLNQNPPKKPHRSMVTAAGGARSIE